MFLLAPLGKKGVNRFGEAFDISILISFLRLVCSFKFYSSFFFCLIFYNFILLQETIIILRFAVPID